jgi:hypothetical protein
VPPTSTANIGLPHRWDLRHTNPTTFNYSCVLH